MKNKPSVTDNLPILQEQELQEQTALIETTAKELQEIFDNSSNSQINPQTLQIYLDKINQPPPSELIEVNKFANNTEYLPISFLEMLLDQVTLGLWEVTDFSYKILINELVGVITLKYYLPFANTWITRIGVAAVQIQTKSNSNPYDINNKISNTLVKQMGQLKAECFKNACKSIGKLFGRDLNRKQEAEFTPAYENEELTLSMSKKATETLNNVKNSMQKSRGDYEL